MADSTPTLDMLCTAVASCPGPDRNTTSGKWSYPAQLLHADALAYYIHTHTRLMALCPGLPGWAGTRKVKAIWILLKLETVSGSGFSWDICKSAPRSRQITMPAHQAAPHRSVFSGRMPFLPLNQRCQSTEGSGLLYTMYLRISAACDADLRRQ